MRNTRKSKNSRTARKWSDYSNPLPTTAVEKRMWERRMIEDSNRTLLPKFQH